jgi:hypothetical protein
MLMCRNAVPEYLVAELFRGMDMQMVFGKYGGGEKGLATEAPFMYRSLRASASGFML